MTLDLAALVMAAAATAVLTFRDPALAETRVERAVLASAWLVSAAAMAWFGHEQGTQWIGVATLVAACAGTGGRPALIMDEVLPAQTKADKQLMRRSRTGQIILLAVIVVAIFILT